MHRPPIHSPELARGSTCLRWSSLPFTFTFCAKRNEWASTARPKPGSELESASSSCTAAVASRPAPPYCSGIVTPSRPSSAARRKSAWLKVSLRSCSAACGSTSRATKSASVAAKSWCSGVGAQRSRRLHSLALIGARIRPGRTARPAPRRTRAPLAGREGGLDEGLDRLAHGGGGAVEDDPEVGHELVGDLGVEPQHAGPRQGEGELEARAEARRLGRAHQAAVLREREHGAGPLAIAHATARGQVRGDARRGT